MTDTIFYLFNLYVVVPATMLREIETISKIEISRVTVVVLVRTKHLIIMEKKTFIACRGLALCVLVRTCCYGLYNSFYFCNVAAGTTTCKLYDSR